MMLSDLIQICQKRIETLFDTYLSPPCPAPQLQEALIYMVKNGGKRIRPLLVYATGHALNASLENLDAPASAIELIHTYSLIHDDLPCMDNADLRRGKPSCHKAYTEAMATLAGDALQSIAFEIIASHPCSLHPEQRLAMIQKLSHASGMNGMIAGQVLDIAGIQSLDGLSSMYQLKTGALLTASVQLGAIAANTQHPSLLTYAKNIGLAFQVQDDLLDYETASATGKTQGLDARNQKTTYPVFLGKERTQILINELYTSAVNALDSLGKKAEPLRELTNSLLQRKK